MKYLFVFVVVWTVRGTWSSHIAHLLKCPVWVHIVFYMLGLVAINGAASIIHMVGH